MFYVQCVTENYISVVSHTLNILRLHFTVIFCCARNVMEAHNIFKFQFFCDCGFMSYFSSDLRYLSDITLYILTIF